MKRSKYLLLFSLSCLLFITGFEQVSFRTVVPSRPILADESFQVQYIIENATDISGFSPPAFTGFRIVAGPDVYSGKVPGIRKNLVLTLAALNAGKFKISGATCLINGKLFRSNDVFVKVVSSRASDDPYVLAPGEDPYKKIRQNLFLRLVLDKQTCYVGEPVVATFKLYSRLQSRSNVVKNPGFYGFSVYDMVEVNDKVKSEERLNGHWFDVHTIRKVQLYPLEAGIFTIDPMELSNEVEFSRTTADKKAKQEISENMYNKDTVTERKANSVVFDMNVKSDPVVITVKPLPGKTPADTFAGAVGTFSIHSFVQKDSLLRNEEDSLVVEINGAGNFQRVNSPAIAWPSSFEVFEPSVKDTFDKQQVPLAGQRRFKYVFVSNKPGFYTIPAISFSFFNLKTRTYTTVTSKPITIFISAKSRRQKMTADVELPPSSGKLSNWLLMSFGLLILLTGASLWMANKRKESGRKKRVELSDTTRPLLPVHELLRPARSVLNANNKTFYEALGRCIWNYFNDRLHGFNIPMIKKDLSAILLSKGIDRQVVDRVVEIIHQCETGVYTNAEMDADRSELFEQTQQLLATMEQALQDKSA